MWKNDPFVSSFELTRSTTRVKAYDTSSSIIIDHLLKEEEDAGQSSKIKTIFFYCDFKDTQKQTPAGVYGSLISQIISVFWGNSLPEDFETFFFRNRDKPPREDQLKKELLRLVKTISHTRIVVDALDECPPAARVEVLKTLLEIRDMSNINLLITSREDVDIKLLLSEEPKLFINAEVNSNDIQHFVTEECERNLSLRRKLKGDTKTEVITTIASKANGM